MKLRCVTMLIAMALTSSALAVERIKAMRFDKSKVETVYVSTGMATVMTFPCEIDEAIVGREQDLKAVVSSTSKKQLTLFSSSSFSATTNLIVRCGKKSDLFVFDLVSNKPKHQDVLKVSMSYGQPLEADLSDMVLIDSSSSHLSKKHRTVIEVAPPVLIEESK